MSSEQSSKLDRRAAIHHDGEAGGLALAARRLRRSRRAASRRFARRSRSPRRRRADELRAAEDVDHLDARRGSSAGRGSSGGRALVDAGSPARLVPVLAAAAGDAVAVARRVGRAADDGDPPRVREDVADDVVGRGLRRASARGCQRSARVVYPPSWKPPRCGVAECYGGAVEYDDDARAARRCCRATPPPISG